MKSKQTATSKQDKNYEKLDPFFFVLVPLVLGIQTIQNTLESIENH